MVKQRRQANQNAGRISTGVSKMTERKNPNKLNAKLYAQGIPVEQIRVLLEKAQQRILTTKTMDDDDCAIKQYIDEAIAWLSPECETCEAKKHDWHLAGYQGNFTKYVCDKCGKEIETKKEPEIADSPAEIADSPDCTESQSTCGNPDCENGIITKWDGPKSARTWPCSICQPEREKTFRSAREIFKEYLPSSLEKPKTEFKKKVFALLEEQGRDWTGLDATVTLYANKYQKALKLMFDRLEAETTPECGIEGRKLQSGIFEVHKKVQANPSPT
jgi:hypothetical protein